MTLLCRVPALCMLGLVAAEAPHDKLEIVIAQYHEDISWSDRFRDVRTVYCESNDLHACDPSWIRVADLGGTGAAFLHHIIENYDKLANWTVFATGEDFDIDSVDDVSGGTLFQDYLRYPEQHNPATDDPEALFVHASKFYLPGVGQSMRAFSNTQGGRFAQGGFWTASRPPACPSGIGGDMWRPYNFSAWRSVYSKLCLKHPSTILKVGLELWHEYVGLPVPPNHVFHYAQGPRFAASRSRIRERPKEEYAHLLEAMRMQSGQCLGFFLEYWWWYIIGRPSGSPCPSGEDDAKLHFPKPIMGKLPCNEPDGPSKKDVEIVMAQYDEDVSWVNDCRHLATIYCKAEDRSKCAAGAIHLNNMGREAQTYLHHIVNRYDDLANWTVFTQAEEPSEGYNGAEWGHLLSGASFADYLNYPKMKGYDADPDSFFLFTTKLRLPDLDEAWRTNWRQFWDVDPPNPGRLPPKCPGRENPDTWKPWRPKKLMKFIGKKCNLSQEMVHEFGERFWHRFVQLPLPPHKILYYAQGARFAASAKRIRQRPKDEYEKLLQLLSTKKGPCFGYLVEFFMWYFIGRPSGQPCPLTSYDLPQSPPANPAASGSFEL